ncbi:YbaK/EbsC family protein [Thioalkalivibrio sp. HK1]|uniref:YbaK/EbsC family protein n=1 Tax=Thioalkalivibrio sp. HK1 TaxID=1469245 RepID=UPI000471FF82|nr:YbaK/EbsC family protein [Thioalkalivibrio sp. HK1]
MAKIKGLDRFRAAMAAKALDCEIITLSDSVRTANEAATAVGCPLGRIAKSLVFRLGDRAVMAVMSGDNRLDPEKLLAALASEDRRTGAEPVVGALVRADADFVRAKTGYAIGGVPPLGHITAFDRFMDEDLFRFDRIWAAAGDPFSLFSIEPSALQKASGAKAIDLKDE